VLRGHNNNNPSGRPAEIMTVSRKKVPIDLSIGTEALGIKLDLGPEKKTINSAAGDLASPCLIEISLPLAWLRELSRQPARSFQRSPASIHSATFRQPVAFVAKGTQAHGHRHNRGCVATCFAFHLTQRESVIMDLMAAGLSNSAIAQRLTLREKTVKNHINHIFAKLAVGSRSQAIALWLGNLDPEFQTDHVSLISSSPPGHHRPGADDSSQRLGQRLTA